jgi:putative membrane protein
MEILVWVVVTAISFIIISYLPIGVQIASFPIALISAVVFGLVNALLKPLLTVFGLLNILNWVTLGLFSLVVNGIILAIAAALVPGFRLKWPIVSALLGALALAIVNSILFNVLSQFFPSVVR